MNVSSETYIAELKAQRNGALDDAAFARALIVEIQRRVEELEKKLAEKPAEEK